MNDWEDWEDDENYSSIHDIMKGAINYLLLFIAISLLSVFIWIIVQGGF